MKLDYVLLKETKTCCRFERREGDDIETIYLKKDKLKAAGIDPNKGITVTIEETQ